MTKIAELMHMIHSAQDYITEMDPNFLRAEKAKTFLDKAIGEYDALYRERQHAATQHTITDYFRPTPSPTPSADPRPGTSTPSTSRSLPSFDSISNISSTDTLLLHHDDSSDDNDDLPPLQRQDTVQGEGLGQ